MKGFPAKNLLIVQGLKYIIVSYTLALVPWIQIYLHPHSNSTQNQILFSWGLKHAP